MTEYSGYLDSACNQTIINDMTWFESFEDCVTYVKVAKSKVKMKCTALGITFYFVSRCSF